MRCPRRDAHRFRRPAAAGATSNSRMLGGHRHVERLGPADHGEVEASGGRIGDRRRHTVRLVADHEGHRTARARSSSGADPVAASATHTGSPRLRASAGRAAVESTSASGVRSTAPAEARTVLGLKGSAVSSVTTHRRAGRRGAADDGADVARIGHPGQHDDERAAPRRRSPRRASRSAGRRRRPPAAGARCRAPDRARPARPARAPRPARRRATATGPAPRVAPGGPRRRRARASTDARRQRLGHQDRSLEDEPTVLPTRTAAPEEAPQLLDSGIAGRQRRPGGPIGPDDPKVAVRRPPGPPARSWPPRRGRRRRRAR